MGTLVTADWHLTDLAKDRYRFKAIRWIIDYIKQNGIGRVIMLGDVTHNKNYHADRLVNDVVELLREITQWAELICLQGNHDYVEADMAFFQFARFIPSIKWVARPTLMTLKGLGVCGFLPHTRNYERDWGDIKKDWAAVALIFAHNSFEGAVGETGRRLSGIPLSVFPDVQVISGDIHAPQALGKNHQLIYVGAPTTQKFGDDYEPRVLVIDNGAIKSVPVPGPQKRLFDVYSDVDGFNNVKYEAGDMVKVRYHLNHSERENWPEIKSDLLAFFSNVGSVQVLPVLAQKALARLPQRVDLKSDRELVKQYGNDQEFSPDQMVVGYELCV